MKATSLNPHTTHTPQQKTHKTMWNFHIDILEYKAFLYEETLLSPFVYIRQLVNAIK